MMRFALPVLAVMVAIVITSTIAIVGVIRDRTVSLLASSLSPELRSGLAYLRFGIGANAGAPGIQDAPLFLSKMQVGGHTSRTGYFAFPLACWRCKP